MSSFSWSHFLLASPKGLGLMLVAQLVLVSLVTGTGWLFSLEVGLIIALLFIALISMQNSVLPQYLFSYFWTSFVYGGLGMILGHKIDLSVDTNLTMQQLNSLSFNAVYLNWMTALMVSACMITCYFADHCKQHKNSRTVRVVIHVVAISAMMFGVYVGHALNLVLHGNTFDRYYLQVLTMSIFFTTGYYCALRCYAVLKASEEKV